MRLLLFFFFISISFFLSSQILFSDLLEKKIRKTITKKLNIKSFDYDMVHSLTELGIKENHVFKIVNEGESLGYFAIDQSMGQYDYFDYLVLFDDNLEILSVKILNYREDYGYEISSMWWLSQFIGKKEGKSMRYEDDIDALSGATISAQSITDSLKLLFDKIYVRLNSSYDKNFLFFLLIHSINIYSLNNSSIF